MGEERDMADAGIREVTELEERRWAAMIAKDTATLGDLFADEMSYTHSNALVDTKASYLKAIDERIFDYQKVERSDTDARRVGDTVLLTGRAQIDVAAGGRQVHLNARYTVVYVRKDGRWQFLCWQSTSIPA
jgi:ketosteroid isomerase-like protein